MVGLVLPVVIAMVALGTEITFLYFKQRQLQVIADAAAFSAATALTRGSPSPSLEAQAVASQMAAASGAGAIVVTVNVPPASGGYTAPGYAAVEVIASQVQTTSMTSLVCQTGACASGLWNVSGRAVALPGGASGACVLALSGSASGAVSASGGAIVSLAGCSLEADSTSASSITAGGGAQISAQQASTAGGYSTNGGGAINVTQSPIQTYVAQPPANPYSGYATPAPSACLRTNYSLSGTKTATIGPGTYCGGINLSGQAALTLQPGVYILNGGDLSLSGGTTLQGSGVSIVLTGSSSSQIGSVSFAGGSTVNLSAPGAGQPMAGIVLFQNPNAPSGNAVNLTGGSNQTLTGAAYFPNGAVNYAGGTGTVSKCTQLVALTLNFTGNSLLQLNCTGIPVQTIGGGGVVSLVE